MTERDCDVLILGAGTAGLKAYKGAVARGAETMIVERGPGGSTCTRVGCMPSKLLLAAGRTAHQARGAAEFGVDVGTITINPERMWQRVRAERDRFVEAVMSDYRAIPEDRLLHGTAVPARCPHHVSRWNMHRRGSSSPHGRRRRLAR